MDYPSTNSAVALICFNRPNETGAVFAAIRKARPKTLLLIADGPRQHVKDDSQRCHAVRDLIAAIDWPCEVHRNYSETNLGCAERVISGLNWAFGIVDRLIVLEDDCVPNQSFFRFCEELLARYRDDDRISMISGNSFVAPSQPCYSYYFSQVHYTWGWATWKSRWTQYDRSLTQWPAVRADGVLAEIFPDSKGVRYWTNIFDHLSLSREGSIWDYQWFFTNLINNRLSIVPKVNLVSNIGFGPAATHTFDKYAFLAALPTAELNFPLLHPSYLMPLRRNDRRTCQEVFFPSLRRRSIHKLKKLYAKAVAGKPIEPFEAVKHAAVYRLTDPLEVKTQLDRATSLQKTDGHQW